MSKYCGYCGNQLEEITYFCPKCGVKVNNVLNNGNEGQVDKGGFSWSVLGFFVPLAGLILYLVWKNEKPKTAKSVGMGAIISVIIQFIIYIVLMVLFGILFYIMASNI